MFRAVPFSDLTRACLTCFLHDQAKGKGAAPAVAEGLGASNIKGVEDSKTKTDIAHESGHDSKFCAFATSLQLRAWHVWTGVYTRRTVYDLHDVH